MSHFAKVKDGRVINVIVAEQEFIDTFVDNIPGEWIQTSYNTRAGIHYGPNGEPDGGVALRGNFAGIGFVYNKNHDVFYTPSPFPSWTMDTTTWTWTPPVPHPTDDKFYSWDEQQKTWVEYVASEEF